MAGCLALCCDARTACRGRSACYHGPPRDLICDLRTVVAPDDVETEIDTGRAPGRCEDLSVIDVQDVRFDSNARKSRGQPLCIPPMRRRAFVIEEAGGGKDEHTRANGHHSGAAAMRASKSIEQDVGRSFVSISPPRNHDGVRPSHGVQPHLHLRWRQGEGLDHDAELERAQSMIGDGDHAMRSPHGRILTKMGIPASRKLRLTRATLLPWRFEMSEVRSRTPVTEVPAADSHAARTHFEGLLGFETDCWDVHAAMALPAPGFVLLDVRSPEDFRKGHVAGAINLPHGRIVERNLADHPTDTLFVVYCAGPHCNGADRAAVRLARLGRPVKKMIGGVEGWKAENFALSAD
jgi:rhodanese-related sulfurtransferase